MNKNKRYQNFAEFYPFYLSEHSNKYCRLLHVCGSLLVLLLFLYILLSQNWPAIFLIPIIGYGFAWIGHYFFEGNRPATFSYPLYSFMGDWVMLKDVLTGKVSFE